MDVRKAFMFAIIALFFALIALVLAENATVTTNNIFNNTTSFSGSTISLFLHNNTDTTMPFSSKLMNRTLISGAPISTITITGLTNGNTLIGNWTSSELNVNLIPSGVHELHLDAFKTGGSGAHVVRLFYVCYTINSTGGNMTLHGTSELSNEVTLGATTEVDTDLLTMDINMNLTDKMFIQVYANQTGSGASPTLTVNFDDLTDSRLILPATQIDITPFLNAKVNKSGDNMTGGLAILETTNSHPILNATNANSPQSPNNATIVSRTVGVQGLGIINTASSSASQGAGIQAFHDDGNALAVGDRLGFMLFGGTFDTTHVPGNTAGLAAIATQAWTSANRGTELHLYSTHNNTSSRADGMVIQASGNVSIPTNGKGICLNSPDGNHWFVSVDNTGTLNTVASTTPCV